MNNMPFIYSNRREYSMYSIYNKMYFVFCILSFLRDLSLFLFRQRQMNLTHPVSTMARLNSCRFNRVFYYFLPILSVTARLGRKSLFEAATKMGKVSKHFTASSFRRCLSASLALFARKFASSRNSPSF